MSVFFVSNWLLLLFFIRKAKNAWIKTPLFNLSTSSADYVATVEEPEPQNISCSTKSRNSDRLKAARQHLGDFYTSWHQDDRSLWLCQIPFTTAFSSVAAWAEPLHSISSSPKTTWSNASIHTNRPLWTSIKAEDRNLWKRHWCKKLSILLGIQPSRTKRRPAELVSTPIWSNTLWNQTCSPSAWSVTLPETPEKDACTLK